MGSRILIVPGRLGVPSSVADALRTRGHVVEVHDLAPGPAAALATGSGFEAVVVRHGGDERAGELVAALRRSAPALPVVLLLREDPARFVRDPAVRYADRVLVDPIDTAVLSMVLAVLLARAAGRDASRAALFPSAASSASSASSAAEPRAPLEAPAARAGGTSHAEPRPSSPAAASTRSSRRAPESPLLPSRAEAWRGRSVVLVGDDATTLDYVQLFLEERQAHVTRVASIAALREAPPAPPLDLILVDRAGDAPYDVAELQALRLAPPLAAARLHVFATAAERAALQPLLEAGVDGLLLKPVRSAQLAELLDTLRP